jgi:GTP:adenosylcobinamide-phosphate guanylyltransferase
MHTRPNMPPSRPAPLDAVILAGGVPKPDHPLFAETQGRHKALLDIAGRPMVQWVLDALAASDRVRRIIIIGLPEDCPAVISRNLTLLPDKGGIIENLSEGVREIHAQDPGASHFLAVSSDIPALRRPMVDEIVDSATNPQVDMYFNVIERSDMEAAWPGVRRTWLRLADGSFCAGDLHVISTHLFAGAALRRFVAWRKSPLRLMAALGPRVLLRMLFNRPSLEGCTDIVWQRMGMRARAVRRYCTEIGMDVDDPSHLLRIRETWDEDGTSH